MYGQKEIRLLVIDENPGYYQSLSGWAEMCRHEYPVVCRHVRSDEEAPKIISEWEPSVVLIDAYLQDGEPFKFVERCRAEPFQVIVMSSEHSQAIEDSARLHGAAGYLTKSEDPDDLERLLSEIAQVAESAHIAH